MLKQVISATEAAQIKKLFDQSRRVVITTHTSPDGDAIGSSLALYEYLTRRGKQVTVIVPNYFPDYLHWMHDADKIIIYDHHRAQAKTFISAADLIVALDYNAINRIDDLAVPIGYANARKLMIDHHLGPDKFCQTIISRPKMSSTCELLFRVFDAIGAMKDVNTYAAEDIYAGMCTDTGRFSFNSNDPEIFNIIADLMRKDIDKDMIIRRLFNQNNESRYRLMGYILYEKLVVLPELHASYHAITREELAKFHYLKGDAEGIVNMPLEIKGMKVSVALREDTERPQICISVRSYDDFPANEMCQRFFNGGGHKNAAGGRLECTMDEAIERVKEAFEAYHELLVSTTES